MGNTFVLTLPWGFGLGRDPDPGAGSPSSSGNDASRARPLRASGKRGVGVGVATADEAGHEDHKDLEALPDHELIARARRLGCDTVGGRACLGILYDRHYEKVARWCLRICGSRQEATDLAQDVFVRVHDRLDTFRGEAHFSTWLYTVARSVAINRGIAERRRRSLSLNSGSVPEPVDPARLPEADLEASELIARLQRALREDLEPLEARVLLLHYAHGMTLPAITRSLGLANRSGAKAYLVGGRRKLERKFGRWLAAQSRTRDRR